jgi:hypothetical protein
MRQKLRSHLTYANVISTLALFLVLAGGTTLAATGGNFILGQSNSASSTTSLTRTGANAGKGLQVTNTSTAAGATALGLNVASGHAPFTVNSGTKVANLNADKLDGIDSTGFLSSGSVKKLIYEAPIGSAKTNIATVGPYTIKASCLVGDAPDDTALQVYANGPAGTFDYRSTSVVNDTDFIAPHLGRQSIPAATDTEIVFPTTDAPEPSKVRVEGTVMLKSGSSLVQVDFNGVALSPPSGKNCYLYGTATMGT